MLKWHQSQVSCLVENGRLIEIFCRILPYSLPTLLPYGHIYFKIRYLLITLCPYQCITFKTSSHRMLVLCYSY